MQPFRAEQRTEMESLRTELQSIRSELSEKIDKLSSRVRAVEEGQWRLDRLLEGRVLLQPGEQAEPEAEPITAPVGG